MEEQSKIDPEILAAANELSYNAGKWVREKLLEAGFSSDEIKVIVHEAMQGIYIDGVNIYGEAMNERKS